MSFDLAGLADAASKVSALLDKVYVDLAQPGVRQVGKALETVVGMGNTVLLPVALLNERARLATQANMERYRRKMEAVADERVIPVAPEIGVPIVEKFTYVTDEKLSELYTELLATASDACRVSKAHPSFVNVINNLSPDEAALLVTLHHSNNLPFVRALAKLHQEHIEYDLGLHVPEFYVSRLAFPDNIRAYMSNLTGLGLIDIDQNKYSSKPGIYEELVENVTKAYAATIATFKEKYDDPSKSRFHGLEIAKGIATVTPFGRQFIDACIGR